MKEAYYFHDDTVIMNYSKKYITYKRDIIETDLFDEFLDHFLVHLKKTHYDLYNFLAEGGKDNELIKKELKFVLTSLLVETPEKINDPYTERPEEISAIIEAGYQYWRSLQRYSILFTTNSEGFADRNFINADVAENDIVLQLYRDVSQRAQGYENGVYSQLQAGTTATKLER